MVPAEREFTTVLLKTALTSASSKSRRQYFRTTLPPQSASLLNKTGSPLMRRTATAVSVRVGIEATGHARWFERLLAELGFELWIGDAARIKATRVRKQKTDRQDAQLLLKLLVAECFPRIWIPSPENRDVRQLLWHRALPQAGSSARLQLLSISAIGQ